MDTGEGSGAAPGQLAWIALAAGLVLVLSGARCSNLSGAFEKPELQFRGLRVKSIGLNGASIDVVVDVYNPNSYRLGIDRFSYDLAIESVHFGAGAIDAPLSVEGRNTATVRLPLHVNWSRLGDVGRGVLQTGSVNYGVKGEMIVATGFGRFRVPYAKSGRFSVLGNGER
jgi:LEA14-like dessication related protein